jgi:hypothetical protein
MTAGQILGALLVAVPFVAVAVIIAVALGWRACLAVFGIVAAIVLTLGAGAYLLTGGK